MRVGECIRAGAILDRRQVGLSDAERLQLEQHLAGCEDCRFDSAALRSFAVAVAVDSASSEGVAQRALRRALVEAEPSAAPPRASRRAPWLVGALAVAATVAMWIGFGSVHDAPRSVELSETQPKASGRIHVSDPSRLEIAHAVVRAQAGTVLRWDGARVHLERGELSVDVDPTPHLPFQVETPEFTVHVTGTSFDVSLQRVSVSHGTVRVASPEGAVLQEQVRAGQTWSLETERRVGAEQESASADPTADLETRAAVAGDRRHVGRAPTPRQRFERAVRLQSTQPVTSLRIYRELERRGGPWAANALFARGQLLMAGGNEREARETFAAYLRRFPNGLNAVDARALLQR